MARSTVLAPVRGEWVPMSFAEFLAWAPEGVRTEWTDGEGIVYATASDRHQAIVLLLTTVMETVNRLFGSGRVSTAPFAMRFQPGGPHREPDILFVRHANLGPWTSQRLIGPADLVVEVLSDDTVGEDRGRKRAQYAALGVPEYLMVDARPGRSEFAFLRLDPDGAYQPIAPDDHGRYHSATLAGFWLDPAWFQRDPLPDPEDLLLAMAPDAYEAWILAKLRAHRLASDAP